MRTRNLGKVIAMWFGTLIAVSPAILIQACATAPTPLEISNSMPAEELAVYNDSFETIRDDTWDRAGMVFNEKQLQNFKLADMRVENDRLVVETKIGSFSKGGLDTKYTLGGDFDIQLECHINLLKNMSGMDQRASLMVYDKSKSIQKSDYVILEVAKRGDKEGSIFSGYGKSGRFHPGNWHRLEQFDGLLRIVRVGNKISTYYKKETDKNWIKLNTFSVTTANLTAGFMLVNYYSSRGVSISAEASITSTFDNFRINAAQFIEEPEI